MGYKHSLVGSKHTFLSMKPVFLLVEAIFIPIHRGPGMQIDASKRAQRIFVGSRVLFRVYGLGFSGYVHSISQEEQYQMSMGDFADIIRPSQMLPHGISENISTPFLHKRS